MKIVAVIPARFGSTRFEGKPLALIAGRPMIEHVYTNAHQSPTVDQVIVATDDQRIIEVVEGFNGTALMTSPNHRSGTDRVYEAAVQLNLSPEDILINVQGDQPLVHPASFDQVVQPLIQDPDLGMSTLAIRINDQSEYHNPKDCKVTLDQQGYALYFSRAPIPFFRDQSENMRSYKHLGIYAYRFWFLEIFNQLPGSPLEQAEKLEQLRALEHGHPIKVVITRFDSPEVDLPEDIKRIEKIMNHGCGS